VGERTVTYADAYRRTTEVSQAVQLARPFGGADRCWLDEAAKSIASGVPASRSLPGLPGAP
jgi:hypothetical protein